MELVGTWSISASSPLGKESYVIKLTNDGSGLISHEKGMVEFSGATISVAPSRQQQLTLVSGFSASNTLDDTVDVELHGHTDIPMSVDFHCKFQSVGKILKGFVEIDKYVKIEINGVMV